MPSLVGLGRRPAEAERKSSVCFCQLGLRFWAIKFVNARSPISRLNSAIILIYLDSGSFLLCTRIYRIFTFKIRWNWRRCVWNLAHNRWPRVCSHVQSFIAALPPVRSLMLSLLVKVWVQNLIKIAVFRRFFSRPGVTVTRHDRENLHHRPILACQFWFW